ncbi:MAG: DUF4157 domain-containing protein [Panacibacter sp.]
MKSPETIHQSKAMHVGNKGISFIQPKLTINNPNDQYEQEADAVADKVMRMENPSIQTKAGNNLYFKPAPITVSALQRKCTHCEEEKKMQRKELNTKETTADNSLENYVGSLSNNGQPLSNEVRNFYEPRFGYDFSNVKVHTDAVAAKSAQSVNALAYTSGNNIVFNNGQYSPQTDSGKRLLGHELTHVVQQGKGVAAKIQKQHVADTGFRYTPPSTVTRSIIEIQGIVGVNPDGVYGENTRIAVEKYQGVLKAAGFYTDTLDGKWGNNTDIAHVAFATAPNAKRRGYNCSGFAFKKFTWVDMAPTKTIYAGMTSLANCSQKCNPHDHKFWYWEVDVEVIDTVSGATAGPFRDFHTVGGQTNNKGEGPDQVMSKNGGRPVEGPKPPLDWKPVSGPVIGIDGAPSPTRNWVISNVDEKCFCNNSLP